MAIGYNEDEHTRNERKPVRRTGKQSKCPALLGAAAALLWSHRHCMPLRLSRAGCSRQFGRASAPTIPHFMHTIRGPNVGTGTSQRPMGHLSLVP